MSPLGGGGGDPMQNSAAYIMMPVSALVMAFLLIGIFKFAPHHEARLQPNGPSRPAVAEGVWEQYDFFGLVDTQWTLRGGRADGDALQYHSNGSLFRELSYRDGKLNGTVFEYYEKNPSRQPPVRGRLANRAERVRAAGVLRKKTEYENGVPNGPYEIYHPNGILKEEGVYRDGQRERGATYGDDGRVKSEPQGETLWTPSR